MNGTYIVAFDKRDMDRNECMEIIASSPLDAFRIYRRLGGNYCNERMLNGCHEPSVHMRLPDGSEGSFMPKIPYGLREEILGRC